MIAPIVDRELWEEVEFLTVALSAARAGPWELYPGLGAIYLSPQWADLFGVNPVPERVTQYLALIDPSDRERVAGEMKRIFLLGEAERWESRHTLAGRVVISRAIRVRPGRAIGADIDIT
jgi:hypothetical protein